MGRRRKGTGTLKRSTARGYLTLIPQVVRGGVRHLTPEGGVAVGRRDQYTRQEWDKRLKQATATATARLDRLVRRLDAGDVPDPTRERRTLDDEGTAWLGELETNRSRSYAIYEGTWRLHVRTDPIGATLLRELRRDHLADWQARLARAGASDSRRRYALERVLQVCRRVAGPAFPVLAELVKPGALRGLKPDAPPVETIPLTTEEMTMLLAHGLTVDTWGTLFAVCVYASARIGEACGLRRRDVDPFRRTLTLAQQVLHSTTDLGVTKGKRSRTVPVDADLIGLLITHMSQSASRGQPARPDDLVFQVRASRGPLKGRWSPISYSVASKAFEKIGRDAGLDLGYGTHRLRHGSAMLALAGGASVPSLQRVLGHTDVRTTMLYLGHAAETMDRRGAEAIGDALRTPHRSPP